MNNRKTEIIDQISDLMRVTGYAGTSILDMATRCNMSKASIYHYFDSKETALIGVVYRAIELKNIDLLVQLGVELAESSYHSTMDIIRGYLESVFSKDEFIEILIHRLGLRLS